MAAILLRDRLRQGDWPDRLSYNPSEHSMERAVPLDTCVAALILN